MRAVQIGVIATILVHLLLLWWAPRVEAFLEFRSDINSANINTKPLELEWIHDTTPLIPSAIESVKAVPLPPVEKKEKPPAPPELFPLFRVNPNAPDNIPDKTQNTSRMNQQVAQEKPSPETGSGVPLVKGEDKEFSDIVTGDSAKATFRATPSEYQPEVQGALAARRTETPLPGEEKSQNTDAPTPGSNIGKIAPNPSAAAEKLVEGMPGASNTEGPAKGLYFTVDPKKPMQRQKLANLGSSIRSNMLIKNELGTASMGVTASDSKWSNYGEYSDKMWEVIIAQFDRIFAQSTTWPTQGSNVIVRFKLNSLGEVSEFLSVEGNADHKTRYQCISAIVARAPYGKWTEDMRGILGKDIILTIEFYFP